MYFLKQKCFKSEKEVTFCVLIPIRRETLEKLFKRFLVLSSYS